jgi:hypothetical protein
MGVMNAERGQALQLPQRSARRRARSRVVSEFEGDIRQLYSQMMHDPVPPHLLRIVRAAVGAKS